jgi:4-hydroxy-tetrahydrodipicolinate synthase
MPAERNLSGVIAPVLTPFGGDGTPDPERFVAHAQWLLADGCSALAPFGTTSEANSLGLDERMDLLERLIDAGVSPARLLPGTGMCSVPDAVTLTRQAVELGCAGCLMLPPFYYKGPSEEGLFRFFARVIDEIADDRLRIYLYHIPPVAQVGFPLPLVGRLRREFPGIVVGMKDSSGDWAHMRSVLEAYPELEFFPGSETHMLAGIRAGAAGVISASANVVARRLRELYDARTNADADTLQTGVTALRDALQAHPMIPLLKAIVAHFRKDAEWAHVRPPFEELDPALAPRIIAGLKSSHQLHLAF